MERRGALLTSVGCLLHMHVLIMRTGLWLSRHAQEEKMTWRGEKLLFGLRSGEAANQIKSAACASVGQV